MRASKLQIAQQQSVNYENSINEINKTRQQASSSSQRVLEKQTSKFSLRQSQQSRKSNGSENQAVEAQKQQFGEVKKAEGRSDEYDEFEENIVCLRFPHLKFCAGNYQEDLSECIFGEVYKNIYLCGFSAGLATKYLMNTGITHVLNVTSVEYTKRMKYFKYLNLFVYNTSNDDIKKHFRITNRFIRDCIEKNGKVLIHSDNGTNIGPCFVLAYMINQLKTPLKQGIEMLMQTIPEIQISQHFAKQLEQYDLEKLALVSMKKQGQ